MQTRNTLVEKFTNEGTKQLKILMMLYKTCNNDCKFCFEKQFDCLPTIQEFKRDIDCCISEVKKHLDSSKFDTTTVNLMGGELFFSDYASDELFKLIDALSEYDIEVRVATNLLYEDMSMLTKTVEHMEKLKMKFTVFSSFDFGDIRFDDSKLKLFDKNIHKLVEYAAERFQVGVEVTRTAYMLKSLLAHDCQQKTFDYIVKHCSICIDELIGGFEYALTFDQSVQLWKLLIDEYSQITDLQSHFADVGRNCLNIKRIVITGGKSYYGCISQKYKLENADDEDKMKFALSHMQHYGCISCMHFNHCPLKCPIERRYSRCDIKEVFDYIDQKGCSL